MAPYSFPWHPSWFETPNTPDLGCFQKQLHPFEDNGDWGFWMEFPPWDANGYFPHQVYFRVTCGHAAFHERVLGWVAPSGSNPFQLLQVPPDAGLGGDFTPRPSDWQKYPVQRGPKDYWFCGQYRDPAGGTWQRDALVGHRFDQYENGTLSTVGWDDTGGDRDYDDLVMEVAVVYRRGWFEWLNKLEVDPGLVARAEQELPRYREGRVPPDTHLAE